ncbi:hypothetical protein [Leptolyngbya sp. FACHB-16]|uniref:hypothetical protein n=1 Tax=unclassified Leptolyngbya TaxID=2650499 RepID=UPI00168447BD|nr:hypothetical protein [Leptolyngbya sp. FACHB-16]MBD1910314.1 hypothetical protein [Leptolyngbya sp. FACHB-8]MBD2155774.1 hypothetical protein [Leptolyngbya sp. FACHB-16]
MDSLHTQIANLSTKIDALQQLIEQLSSKLLSTGSGDRWVPGGGSHRTAVQDGMVGYQSLRHQSALESEFDHKDILADVDLVDSETHSGDHQTLSPDLQIQRLTAQLTAAYNRIAALEEQLLARRVSH